MFFAFFLIIIIIIIGLQKRRDDLKHITDIIDEAPEWQEYKQVSDEVVDRIHAEWADNDEPVTRHSVQQLHAHVADVVEEMRDHYSKKLHARVQGELARGIDSPLARLIAQQRDASSSLAAAMRHDGMLESGAYPDAIPLTSRNDTADAKPISKEKEAFINPNLQLQLDRRMQKPVDSSLPKAKFSLSLDDLSAVPDENSNDTQPPPLSTNNDDIDNEFDEFNDDIDDDIDDDDDDMAEFDEHGIDEQALDNTLTSPSTTTKQTTSTTTTANEPDANTTTNSETTHAHPFNAASIRKM